MKFPPYILLLTSLIVSGCATDETTVKPSAQKEPVAQPDSKSAEKSKPAEKKCPINTPKRKVFVPTPKLHR